MRTPPNFNPFHPAFWTLHRTALAAVSLWFTAMGSWPLFGIHENHTDLAGDPSLFVDWALHLVGLYCLWFHVGQYVWGAAVDWWSHQREEIWRIQDETADLKRKAARIRKQTEERRAALRVLRASNDEVEELLAELRSANEQRRRGDTP